MPRHAMILCTSSRYMLRPCRTSTLLTTHLGADCLTQNGRLAGYMCACEHKINKSMTPKEPRGKSPPDSEVSYNSTIGRCTIAGICG